MNSHHPYYILVQTIRLVGLLGLLLGSTHATGSTVLQNGAVVYLDKTASDQVAIDIRLTDPEPITRVTARMSGKPVSISGSSNYPLAGQSSAILFLVDTSDPSRQAAVDRAINHIEQIVAQSASHLSFGLARFDTNLHILSPIGTSRKQLVTQANALKAVGKTTELYRNTLGAIRVLSKYPANRKFLFLLSDGLAEDRAYFHRDVVQSALDNNVSIYTIGYTGTVSRSVALQTLRRLSEDTGGQYLPTATGSYQLDTAALQNLLDNLDNGIQLKASLKDIVQAGIGGTQPLNLSIDLATSSHLVAIPVKLPRIAAPQYQQVTTSTSPQPAQQVIVKHLPVADEVRDNSWMLLIAVSLLMMGLIIFLALRLRSDTLSNGKPAEQVEDSQDAYAWLEQINGTDHRRFPIRSNQIKIGRFRGNDVALHDPAVSRYHAEIRFNDDGQFMIADLGSKNGIMVNDEEVYERALHDQDIIEIGDIRLRFSIPSDFAADMEDTQMFRTQFPPSNQTNH